MKFDLTKPCPDCPFLREGGVKHLGKARAKEIADAMAKNPGSTFACHKTTEHDDEGDYIRSDREQHCAGALIFAEKVNPSGTQMMRIMERFGGYDPARLSNQGAVCDSVLEFLAVQSI